MTCLNELQIRGQAFRDDWCEVEPIYCCFFSRRISELASSQQRKFANFQSPSQSSHPHPSPQHYRTASRSIAELRVVGIETSRTESLTEEPSPESNDLVMSRLRTRETIITPCVGLAPSLINVCTRKKRNSTAVHSSTAVIAHGFWAHIESIPWTTSNRQTSKLALRRGGEERLELLVTFLLLGRTASDPSTTAWLNPLSSGSKIDQPQKKCPPRAQPPSDFRDTSHRLHGRRFSLAQEKQRYARSKLNSLLSKCVHSVQRTRRCDRIACYSVLLRLCVMMA